MTSEIKDYSAIRMMNLRGPEVEMAVVPAMATDTEQDINTYEKEEWLNMFRLFLPNLSEFEIDEFKLKHLISRYHLFRK